MNLYFIKLSQEAIENQGHITVMIYKDDPRYHRKQIFLLFQGHYVLRQSMLFRETKVSFIKGKEEIQKMSIGLPKK